MNREPVDHLDPVQRSLLITLKGRAEDFPPEAPILGDPIAAQITERLDVDMTRVRLTTGVPLAIVIRSRMLDRLVTDFLRRNRRAVVVELGCGLETRQWRIDVPDGTEWYNVDFAPVMELRGRVLPPRRGDHPVAAALPDCGWLRDVPDDRAVIVVADGLFGFLDPDTVATVLREITGHFPHGELVFNAYTPLVARMIANTTTRSVGLPKGYRGFGIADPRELTARCPGLGFVEEQTGVTAPETARLPWFTRFVARLFAHWPAQARRGVWVLRYAFGAEPGRV